MGTHIDNPILAEVGTVVKRKKGKIYTVSDKPIIDGDIVWNQASKSIDKCVAVFPDSNSIIVQFDTGMRASLFLNWFQKIVITLIKRKKSRR